MKTAILHAGRAPMSLIPKYGDYDGMSKALLGLSPPEATTYAVLNGTFPHSPDDYDLYVITGSPCGVYEDLPWIPRLEDFIRSAFETQAKLIGLCFGHQIIAQAMGGTVVKSEKGYGIGVMDYDLTYMTTPQETISLCAWHQDQVIMSPESASTFLTSDFCPIAGLLYGDQAISFQPHPEFSTNFMRDMIEVRRGHTISNGMADTAQTTLSKQTDTPLIQQIVQTLI